VYVPADGRVFERVNTEYLRRKLDFF
jgi:hypothetical protein